jgi:methionine-R-sulfoxide reductase
MTIHKIAVLMLGFTFYACTNFGQSNEAKKTEGKSSDAPFTIVKSEDEWKKILSPEQYHVLREKGTERAFTGKYYTTNDKGVYSCAACGNELFTSDMKFDSECGWPSFDKAIKGGKIKTAVDRSYGMVRTEIMCAKCGGHLGHLFDDGPTITGKRYCVNSASLNFVKDKK